MKVYQLATISDQDGLDWKERDVKIRKNYEKAQKQIENWGTERRMQLYEEDKEADIIYVTDFPHSILVSEKAKQLFTPFIKEKEIMWLPVEDRGNRYYLIYGLTAYAITYKKLEIPYEHTKYFFYEKEFFENHISEHLFFWVQEKDQISRMLFVTDKGMELLRKLEWGGCKAEQVGEVWREPINKEILIKVIIETVKKICSDLLETKGDRIRKIKIEYFYDGESTDLGVGVQSYNSKTGETQEEYISFMVTDEYKELSWKIYAYLDAFDEKLFILKELAESIENCLITEKNFYQKIEEIITVCYD